jgi:polyisoprenoid-binding protein YceI
MPVRHLLLAFLNLSLVSGTVTAQQQSLDIDPVKSEVQFTLSDPVHAVHGTFRVQTGTVVFDQANGRMTGTIAVDARSGNSGNGSRDKKMMQEELKAASFSTVIFAPKRFSGTLSPAGDSNIVVDGTFTLLGMPHEISVLMQVHLDGTQCKATGAFPIPYVQWGMKDPSNFILHVGKEVTINLILVGTVASGRPG